MTSEIKYILFPGEAETMIQTLETVDYSEFGHERWFKHHGYINKLNMQAVDSAQNNSDEFVKEYLISHGKLPLLVYDLIMVELWKQRVFSTILEDQLEPTGTFSIYTVLYHELVLANLLETVTFHMDAAEALGDSAVDLADWCYRALCYLVAEFPTEERKTEYLSLKDKFAFESNLEDLERQQRVIAFDKGMKAISLVRHLIDHSLSSHNALPLGVGRRLLQTNDITLVLCQLIEQAPWSATAMDKETGRFKRFLWQESGTWIAEDKADKPVGKAEAQVWLSLYQIVLTNNSTLRYDCTVSHRRAALLRLRPYLTEDRLDILPVLVDLRRFLEQLSLSEASGGCGSSAASNVSDVCLVELVPEIRESLCRKYVKKWKQMSIAFRDFTESDRGKQAAQRAAAEWTDTFSEGNLERLFAAMGDNELGRTPRCVVCGNPATKRCSRCRHEWYCRRGCQVKHWPKHKSACDLMSETIKSENEQKL